MRCGHKLSQLEVTGTRAYSTQANIDDCIEWDPVKKKRVLKRFADFEECMKKHKRGEF